MAGRTKKSAARLDREIRAALAKPLKRSHHVTRREADDEEWDVAIDAVLEGNPKKAAQVYHAIHREHGYVLPPQRFYDALREAGVDIFDLSEHFDKLIAKEPTARTPLYSDFTFRILKADGSIETRHYRSSPRISRDGARKRLVDAGVVDPSLEARRVIPGGWDLNETKFKDIPKRASPLP